MPFDFSIREGAVKMFRFIEYRRRKAFGGLTDREPSPMRDRWFQVMIGPA